eukprot:TRINITY_DN1337_c0_g1_i3.p1 TRINITY_DN1337_c0_g1~~TRINITY_DN1337_c0_g1_i3.p1  ORF type:complete len:186 (+),score=32.54 TRINITY_DN1337_c0_g1_i3:561-1118(+)
MAAHNIKVVAEKNKDNHDSKPPKYNFVVGEIVRVRDRRPVVGGKKAPFNYVAKVHAVLPPYGRNVKLEWMGYYADDWRNPKPNTQGGPNPTDLVGTMSSIWSIEYLKPLQCLENERLRRNEEYSASTLPTLFEPSILSLSLSDTCPVNFYNYNYHNDVYIHNTCSHFGRFVELSNTNLQRDACLL